MLKTIFKCYSKIWVKY